MHRVLRRAQTDDPYFIRKAFVSHYLNIPFHVINDTSLYPRTLIEELFAASVYLMRNFELAPYRNDDMEAMIEKRVKNGEL